MAFKLKVYTSKNFLLKLEEFKLRTIEEFGQDIDIESYLFFKTIIYQKAPQIITDISEDEICSIKEMTSEQILGNEKEDLIRLIKPSSYSIKSDNGLIQKLKNKELINNEDLPHYLFLGEVSEAICKEIEMQYGIICYSINRLIVDKKIRMVCLERLRNTSQALYDKINEFSLNDIHINDPYFFKKASGAEIRTEVITRFLKRPTHFKAALKVLVTTALEDRTDKELKEWEKKFNTELNSNQQHSSFLVELGNNNDGTNHDRYIFTNKHINIVGNSFFASKETHYTSYPIGIYGNFFN